MPAAVLSPTEHAARNDEIRRLHAEGITQAELCRRYKLSPGRMSQIVNRVVDPRWAKDVPVTQGQILRLGTRLDAVEQALVELDKRLTAIEAGIARLGSRQPAGPGPRKLCATCQREPAGPGLIFCPSCNHERLQRQVPESTVAPPILGGYACGAERRL